jgi:hypothetical protein
VGGNSTPEVASRLVICVVSLGNGRAIGEPRFDSWLEEEVDAFSKASVLLLKSTHPLT